MLESPLVFIIFNRPETTLQVWARIRAAKPSRLFLISDGPRKGHSADLERCATVRGIVDCVDWPCRVSRDYSEVNMGNAVRVSSGLNWVFSQVEEAIILEDDCLPDASFFPFCAELLARYRHETRVVQIAGCSFQPQVFAGKDSYFFSRYTHSWGWATWRRAWQLYDHSMRTWHESRGGDWLPKLIANPAERRIWEECFDATLAGRVNTWDYRWTFSIWRQQGLSILPYRNLISNIGFGSDATHTRRSSPFAALGLSPMPFPLVHPDSFDRDESADALTSRLVFTPPGWPVRIRRKLKQWLSR